MRDYEKKRWELLQNTGKALRDGFEQSDKWNPREFEAAMMDVQALETQHLCEVAASLGIINLPKQRAWVSRDGSKTVYYFDKEECLKLLSMISEARFSYWKRWVDLLTPIITVLISLLALVVSIIALTRT